MRRAGYFVLCALPSLPLACSLPRCEEGVPRIDPEAIARAHVEETLGTSRRWTYRVSEEKSGWNVLVMPETSRFGGDHFMLILDEEGEVVRTVPGR